MNKFKRPPKVSDNDDDDGRNEKKKKKNEMIMMMLYVETGWEEDKGTDGSTVRWMDGWVGSLKQPQSKLYSNLWLTHLVIECRMYLIIPTF